MSDQGIHGPNYRPENVRLVRQAVEGMRGEWYVLRDFDGRELCFFSVTTAGHAEALAALKGRRAVIKAALTRRANKARKAGA